MKPIVFLTYGQKLEFVLLKKTLKRLFFGQIIPKELKIK